MKKKVMFLAILIMLFLLTGCSVESEVEISYTGDVHEEVTILTNTIAFKNDNYTIKQMVESSISNYSAALDFRGYVSETIVGNEESGAKFSKEYKSICSYFQDTGFNQYVYKHIDCTEDDYYITIKNDTEYIPYCNNCSDWPSLNNVILKLTLPIKAEEHNADNVDGNTYIWKYDENTTNKDFYIKIDKDAFEENKNEVEKQNKDNALRKNIIIVVGIITLTTILIFIGIILYKKYKSNKLEY